MKNSSQTRLSLWQERLSVNEAAYSEELGKMDIREQLNSGSRVLRSIVADDKKTEAVHVRNIIAECIEAQVDANVPQPKVTAMRKEDEPLADLIEAMIRNELDRMPFEVMNDMMARTVPIQGGGMWLCEWDNTMRTHVTVGEMCVSTLHPKQVIPQDGVYDKIEDMDYIFIKLPQTKEYISRRYGVNVDDESESEPEVKGSDSGEESDGMVTQYVAYYRNDTGGIGIFSWVNDTVLEDLEDYQARRLKRCVKCGATEPSGVEPMGEQTVDGNKPGEGNEISKNTAVFSSLTAFAQDDNLEGCLAMQSVPYGQDDKPSPSPKRKGACVYCGNNVFEETEEEYEEVYAPVMRSFGEPIPGEDMLTGEPTRIPYYKPNIYPAVLQRNVSVFGRFLGESDVDKVSDQQNTTNIIHGNIIDKLLAAGSYMTMPAKATIQNDARRKKVVYIDRLEDETLFKSIDMDEDISQDVLYLTQVYEEARQAIGITDSFQGRKDQTATSGKAKEFAAAQSAGRLESKRVMKDAAFAALFEAMFKFKLAYADEARPVVSNDIEGNAQYKEFNRYDFLKQDDAGEWYWNDRFLFSCDTSSPLASNREAMWQETRLNLQTGAFGDPANPQTLLLFWIKMEQLHYPDAGHTKKYIEKILQQQQEAQAQQQKTQQELMKQQQDAERVRQDMISDNEQQRAIVEVKRQAREDVIKAAQMGQGRPYGESAILQ
ncbi:MAG: hypothetical protein ACYCWE_20715 [Eubacteriales bacterium]